MAHNIKYQQKAYSIIMCIKINVRERERPKWRKKKKKKNTVEVPFYCIGVCLDDIGFAKRVA